MNGWIIILVLLLIVFFGAVNTVVILGIIWLAMTVLGGGSNEGPERVH